MRTAKGFLADIGDRPSDDGARLIFADWLEDNGDLARAEFIRVQCCLAATDEFDPARFDLHEQEQDLLAEHGSRWRSELPPALRDENVTWRRGFVAEITTTGAKFLRHGAKLFDSTPLESLTLLKVEQRLDDLTQSGLLSRLRELQPIFAQPWQTSDRLQTLLKAPTLTGLRSLALSSLGQGEEGRRIGVLLSRWAGLANLRRLSLRCCVLGEEGTRALLSSPLLGPLESLDLLESGLSASMAGLLARRKGMALRELNLGYNTLSVAGAMMLADSPQLAGLRRLAIDSASLGIEGARELVASPHLAGLRSLDIGGNVQVPDGPVLADALARSQMTNLARLDLVSAWIGNTGAAALAGSDRLVGLGHLELAANVITDAGARTLAGSPYLGRLHTLRLVGNPISADGLLALLDSPRLPALRALKLQSNSLDPSAALQLARCAGASRLRRLELDRCPIGPLGTTVLAESPHLAALTHLSLIGCGIGNAGVTALARSPHLTNLRELHLTGNAIRADEARALADSPQLARLRVLRMSHNAIGREGALALARSPYLNRLMLLEVSSRGLDKAPKQALRERFGPAVRIG